MLIAELPWLPLPPDDFAVQCKALGQSTTAPGMALRQLATARLSGRQALVLSRALDRCRAAGLDLAPLDPLRLGILSNATFDMIADHLPAAALRHGVAVDLIVPPFDQAMQQALDPGSMIHARQSEAILLAFDHRWYGIEGASFDQEAAAQLAKASEMLRMLIDALQANGRAACILQTVPHPPQALFGNLEPAIGSSLCVMIDALNRQIVQIASETGSCLLDSAALARRIGTDRWFDPVQWAAYKFPFASSCFPAYSDTLGRLLGALRGKSRKCLVLDLDNTVWGGVIGDDGLNGIVLERGDPRGEGHLAVQQMARSLRMRGIMLAVSSKNDDANARLPFREHPAMILKESDISVFQANWQDKPSNLEAIATALNIGLDALVFLDDNPAERAQMRAALPMVAVPELPDDPIWFARYLDAAGYFETISFTREDQLRVASYAADTQRAEVRGKARDLGDYLASLEMVMHVAPFNALHRKRIAQLTNKTNQFNLTTRRRTEDEIRHIEEDASNFTMQAALADRFGDLGTVALVICHPLPDEGTTWYIDTWLMSCRVLGREVERAMLQTIICQARKAGISKLRGHYLPTAKNGMVADHYSRLGFEPLCLTVGRDDATQAEVKETVWSLDLALQEDSSLPMRIESTFD